LFMAFLSNYLIANAAGGASANWLFGFPAWRWMFWIEVLPSVLFLVAIFCIPESPRYLVAVGRRDDAHKVIASISGHATAGGIVEEIVDSLKDCTKPRLRDVIEKHTGKVSRVVWVGIGLAALQQLVGINVVFYYSAVLWRAAGFSENDALLTTVISGVVNVVSTFVAIALVDRVGRKPLLLIGSIGMAVSLGALAVIFSTGQMVDGELKLGGAYGMAALFAANLYVVFFAFSWGPIMWVMLGEMFPNHLRGSALSICGFVQWMANFAVTLTFPMLLGSVGLGVSYGIYAFFAAVSVLFVVKAVRETKGMTLEQMKN